MRPSRSLALTLVCALFLPVTAIAQEELARGYRCIRQEAEFAQIGVGLVGETAVPEILIERLPVDVAVLEFQAFRVSGTDPPEFGEVPVDVLPPVIEGDELVQEVHFLEPGVIAYVYSLNRSLFPHETITGGLGVAGDSPINNLFENPAEDILEQINLLEQRVNAWVNDKLCTAFSIIPVSSASYNQECSGAPEPRLISFDDRPGAHVLPSNEGRASVSIAIGSAEALNCQNDVGLAFAGVTVTPAVLAEANVGTAFQILHADARNAGKRAKATVRIRGGGTASNPYGFETHLGAWADNPFLPAPLPAPPGSPVVPAGAAVSDRIVIEFGSGMGPGFQASQSAHLNSALLYAVTAEAFSCASDRSEMGSAYDESFDVYLSDGGIYQARAAHCAAGISIGFAEANYLMMGTTASPLPHCPGVGPTPIPVFDFVENDRRGLRLESVEVDFHHIDLEVVSVSVNDFTPLDGIIAQVLAEVRNGGSAPAYSVQVQLRDNGVPRGIWVIPFLDVGQSERFRFPWDTTGLFGTGHHTLSVYVESLTIAELDYADNSGSVGNVVVQPSLKAAFVTRGRTVGGRCNDCGAVDVFDTQSLVRIGSIDVKAATGVNDPRPRAIAVPDAGTTAWLVTELHPNRRSFGLLGIDVMSCYGGICQRLGPPAPGPAPWPTSAQGGISVRADGAFAFVPYNSNSLRASIAAFPLSPSGAGSPTTTVLPFSTQGLDPNSKSSVALAPSGTGREELYVVGGHAQLNYARAFRIAVSDRDFTVDSLVVERFDLHAASGGLDRLPLAVEYTAERQQGIGPVWGHRAVLTDARGGAFITFDTNCEGRDSTATFGPPCTLGHTAIATRPLLAELSSARDGLITAATVPISFLGPDIFWGMNPDQPSASPTPSGTGCAGPPGRCDGYFADLALSFPIARTTNVNLVQEFWVADHGHNSGAIDIYERGGQWQSFGIPLLTPAEAIAIVPIPLSGPPWLFPPPLPWPDPLPVPWPPGLQRFWNLIRIDAIERDTVSIFVPVVNLGEAPVDLELEFEDLPEGWQADWSPAALGDVAPFADELENLRFVPVTLTSPGWFEEAATFGLRAFPLGSPPGDAAVIFMRVENANAVPRRDDDGTREGVVDLAAGGEAAAKSIEMLGDPEHLIEARLWLHANASIPPAKARAPEYRVQVNGDPARELILDPVVLFDDDPLSFEWVSLDLPTAWLQSGLNELIVEPTTPAPTLGISVGIDLEHDVDRSWWNTVSGGCPGDPAGCAGELMMLLELVFDCDADGFLDHAELRSGLSQDVDGDGLLDRCTGAVAIDEVDSPLLPVQPLIAYPNPFNPRVTLRLALDRPSWAELTVYDLRGQRVAVVWSGHLPGGESEFIWDGTDQRGESVASGVYFVRAVAAGKEEHCKLVLLR